MDDFDIGENTVDTIYQAVRVGCYFAWRKNVKLKASGEKRILKKFPQDPRVTWSEWKLKEGMFFRKVKS